MKSRALQSTLGGLLVVIGLVTIVGCANNEGNDWERLVCDVESVNGGMPLVSAYLNPGSDDEVGTSDDYQTIDTVLVIFHARPYGSAIMLPEDSAHSWFQITSYDINWETDPGAPADLSPHNVTRASIDVMVPVYEEGGSSVLVVGIDMKNADWFFDLFNNLIPSFQANARFTFYGHESGSDKEVAIAAGMRVNFIGLEAGD